MNKSKDFDIFISYSRKDFDEVNSFLNLLKRRIPGLRYWFDLTGIESGDEFMDKIVTAIDKSDKVLFMVSDNSIMSPWTKKEVIYAENTGHTLIPVLLRGAKLKGWFLFNYGLIDSIDSSDPRQVDKLIDNLSTWIKKPATKSQRLIRVYNSSHKCGLVDTDCNTIVPCVYNNIGPFTDHLACVQNDSDRWGFIDESGNVVISPIYKNFYPGFSDSLASVQNDSGKYGYIDKRGDTVIPFIYKNASGFSEGLAGVINEFDQKGYIDKQGNLKIPFGFSYGDAFREGLAKIGRCELKYDPTKGIFIKTHEKFGFINKAGTTVIPCVYDDLFKTGDFHDGYARIGSKILEYDPHHGEFTDKIKCGYIDKSGNIVIPCIYTDAKDFSEGLAPVQNESDKWGFIDKSGNVVIPFIYRNAQAFNEGLAAVCDDQFYWGYIDKTGRCIIPCIYKDTYKFFDGLAAVSDKSGKWGVINRNGDSIIPFIYSSTLL